MHRPPSATLLPCPNGAGDKLSDGLVGLAADAPKTLEAQVAAVWHSAAENERKPTTAIDLAWKIRRLTQLQVPMPEICERLGISSSTAAKHLRLLTLPVATQLAVHEGKISNANALADASKRGEGSTTGPRAGLRRSAILRAVSSTHEERPRPATLPKSARQLDDLIAAMHGDDTAKARLDATALAWLTFYDCR